MIDKKLIFLLKKQIMQAYRYIFTVEQNRIVIDLPPGYNHKSVEVIVLPVERNNPETVPQPDPENKNEQLKELLSIGTWSEDDLKSVKESQNLINQWKIDRF
jgi:hypothetical protein